MSDSWFNRDIPVCQQEKGTRIAMIYDCLQVTVCKCRELFSVLTQTYVCGIMKHKRTYVLCRGPKMGKPLNSNR